MRVAVFHNLPTGGAKRALVEMVAQLRAAGDTVDVFVPSTAEEEFLPIADAASSVTVVPGPRVGRGLVPQFGRLLRAAASTQQRIARMIDEAAYDVAFVHHCRFVQTPWILRYLRTPSVYYCQEPLRIAYESRLQLAGLARLRLWAPAIGVARIDRSNVAAAGNVLASSAYARESILRAYGVDASVVPLGVNPGRFPVADAAQRGRTVLSVGAISPFKGHALTIRSIGTIPSERRPPFVVVGDRAAGGEAEMLQALAAAQGVNFEIRTRVTDADLVAAYQAAGVVVCAAELEPFGLTTLEAGSTGAAVVAVREGGYRETIVDGVTGCLVDARDPVAMGRQIDQVLSDRALRERIGSNAAAHVREHWTWQRTGELLRERLLAAAA